MAMNETNPLNIIEEANSKTLDYFNDVYVHDLELVQELKTERLELDVQIEAFEKTKDLYTYRTDNRRNVFSPLASEQDRDATATRGRQIASKLQDLTDARQQLDDRITELEKEVSFYKEQVEMLSKAEKCIHTVLVGRNHDDDNTDSDDDAIEFIETDTEALHSKHHGYQIFQMEDLEHQHFASILNQNVKQELLSNLNKMDTLKWLLHSDPVRASITLEELYHSSSQIVSSIDRLLDQTHYNIDIRQPLADQIHTLVSHYKELHPECGIEDSCDCNDPELSLPPFIIYRLLTLLEEVFDNIFKHANADKISSKIFISSRLIDVYIHDNGIGIPEDYLERSHPFSGLHKLHEIIYQLDGKVQITGDLISGTSVRFSFPIKE